MEIPDDQARVAVLGAGSWGTAFAKVLADAGRDVTMWARRPEVAAAIRESRPQPGLPARARLPERVTATTDAAEALDGAELVGLAVPSQTLRGNLADWAGDRCDPPTPRWSRLMKGIELGTDQADEPGHRGDRRGRPRTGWWWSPGPTWPPRSPPSSPPRPWWPCTDLERATAVQQAIATPYFRPYTNDDVIGCELGGAVKNVIALAYGMATAMGLGDNTKASLITRGLAETARLGVALGADPLTFAGLAGLGDLVATCSSPLSRNRTFGEHLGRGETLEQAQAATRQTAEGVKSCLAIRDLARAHGVEMPITEQVELVCHEGVDPRVARGRADEPGDEAGVNPAAHWHDVRPVLSTPGCREPVAGRAVPARPGVRRALPPRPGDGAGRRRRLRAPRQPHPAPAGGGDRRAGGRRLPGLRQRQAAITGRAARRCCAPATRVLLPSRRLLHRPARSPTSARCTALGITVVTAPTAGPYPSFDGVRLVLLESPANPGLDVCDIAALVAAAARRRRAGRGGQHHRDAARPAAAGARRRPGGGVRHQGADRALRPAARLRRDPFGRAPGPGTAWRDATGGDPRRVRRLAGAPVPGHAGPAAGPADRQRGARSPTLLSGHPAVPSVRWPGLPTDPSYAIASTQMRRIPGVVSFDPAVGRAGGPLPAASRLVVRGDLVRRPAHHRRPARAVGRRRDPGLVRLSCGIEDAADLVADLTAALDPWANREGESGCRYPRGNTRTGRVTGCEHFE